MKRFSEFVQIDEFAGAVRAGTKLLLPAVKAAAKTPVVKRAVKTVTRAADDVIDAGKAVVRAKPKPAVKPAGAKINPSRIRDFAPAPEKPKPGTLVPFPKPAEPVQLPIPVRPTRQPAPAPITTPAPVTEPVPAPVIEPETTPQRKTSPMRDLATLLATSLATALRTDTKTDVKPETKTQTQPKPYIPTPPPPTITTSPPPPLVPIALPPGGDEKGGKGKEGKSRTVYAKGVFFNK